MRAALLFLAGSALLAASDCLCLAPGQPPDVAPLLSGTTRRDAYLFALIDAIDLLGANQKAEKTDLLLQARSMAATLDQQERTYVEGDILDAMIRINFDEALQLLEQLLVQHQDNRRRLSELHGSLATLTPQLLLRDKLDQTERLLQLASNKGDIPYTPLLAFLKRLSPDDPRRAQWLTRVNRAYRETPSPAMGRFVIDSKEILSPAERLPLLESVLASITAAPGKEDLMRYTLIFRDNLNVSVSTRANNTAIILAEELSQTFESGWAKALENSAEMREAIAKLRDANNGSLAGLKVMGSATAPANRPGSVIIHTPSTRDIEIVKLIESSLPDALEAIGKIEVPSERYSLYLTALRKQYSTTVAEQAITAATQIKDPMDSARALISLYPLAQSLQPRVESLLLERLGEAARAEADDKTGNGAAIGMWNATYIANRLAHLKGANSSCQDQEWLNQMSDVDIRVLMRVQFLRGACKLPATNRGVIVKGKAK